AIGHLPETLADRCIVIRMQRKRGDEECERLRDLDSEIINPKSEIINGPSSVHPSTISSQPSTSSSVRQRCAKFGIEQREATAIGRAEIPKELNARAADIWEPLFVIADIAGGDWPAKARAAAVALTMSAQENSLTGALLFDIGMTFFSSKTDRLF